MKKPTRKLRKAITLLTILALLVMILPMAVMASQGRFPLLPEQAADRARQAHADRLALTSETTAATTVPTPAEVQQPAATTAPAPAGTLPSLPGQPAAGDSTGIPAAPAETALPDAPGETDAEADEDEDEDGVRAQFVATRNAWAKAFGITPGHANLIDKLAFASGIDLMDPAAVLAFRELWGAKLTDAADPLDIKGLQAAIREARIAAGLPVDDEDEKEAPEAADEDETDADVDASLDEDDDAASTTGRQAGKTAGPSRPSGKPEAGKAAKGVGPRAKPAK